MLTCSWTAAIMAAVCLYFMLAQLRKLCRGRTTMKKAVPVLVLLCLCMTALLKLEGGI